MTVQHYDVVECTFAKAHLTLEELREFVENTKAFDGKTIIDGEWKEPKIGSAIKPSRIKVRRAMFGATAVQDPWP